VVPRFPPTANPTASIAIASTPSAWVTTNGPGSPAGVICGLPYVSRLGSASSLARLRRASATIPPKTATK
jgi:hypothetical protein